MIAKGLYSEAIKELLTFEEMLKTIYSDADPQYSWLEVKDALVEAIDIFKKRYDSREEE